VSEPTISLTIDGERHRITVATDRTLVDMLRDDLDRVATKKGCGIGRCGACTLLMDGLAVNACMVLGWQADGAEIVTPAGLDAVPEAVVVRRALAEENAFQCGYCAPGFTISILALLRTQPEPDLPAIREALAGNICRCTGYHSIIRGTLAAARALKDAKQGKTP